MELPSYFNKYLSNIQPSIERVAAVSDAQVTLREHLVNDCALKWEAEHSVLAGSYGRDTACHPIKDADVVLLMKHKKVEDENRKPNPVEVLTDLKKGIEEYYENVDIREQRRSIRVTVEGETTDNEVFLDVVPAIAPNGSEKPLWVPDRERQKWLQSNPVGYAIYATEKNQKTKGRYVKLVKTLKAWLTRHIQEFNRPKSYLMEVLVNKSYADTSESLPVAFHGTMRNLLEFLDPYAQKGEMPLIPDPSLQGNDLSQSCRWTLSSLKALAFDLKKSVDLSRRAIDEKDKDRSVTLWKDVLGPSYPESLSDEEAKLGENPQVTRKEYSHDVSIRARVAKEKGGTLIEEYPSGGRRLEKGMWLKFEITKCTVPEGFEVNWLVRNHGKEARADRDGLGHNTRTKEKTQWEKTQYKGHHFMDCEILKDNKRLAVTRHRVNIR